MEPSDKVRIFYLRDKHKFPVACVASTVQNSVLNFAISVHNPLDTYSKKIARKIAETRLAHPGYLSGTIECLDQKQAKQTLVNAIRSQKNWPTKAVAAAKLWLKLQADNAKKAEAAQKAKDEIDVQYTDYYENHSNENDIAS